MLAGFAGGTADAFTLFERFEGKLEKYGNLDPRRHRAGQGLARRSLPAPARGAAAGGRSAEPVRDLGNGRCHRAGVRGGRHRLGRAALRSGRCARADREHRARRARPSSRRSLGIAADICIYTNRNLSVEELPARRDRRASATAPGAATSTSSGRRAAKRAVAIALRNRWRRMQVDEPLRQEITPKNILMIGPTGVGKTEIARRLATPGGARRS